MTGLLSVERQEVIPQVPSISKLGDCGLPRGSSEFDYEIAEHLIQQSKDWRNGSGACTINPTVERGSPMEFIVAGVAQTEDQNISDDSVHSRQQMRPVSPQERASDAQYAPISIPPALGQICR